MEAAAPGREGLVPRIAIADNGRACARWRPWRWFRRRLLSATARLKGCPASPERLALRTSESDVARSANLSGERYDVRVDTSKGAIVIAVHRDWAPRGADRFHELVDVALLRRLALLPRREGTVGAVWHRRRPGSRRRRGGRGRFPMILAASRTRAARVAFAFAVAQRSYHAGLHQPARQFVSRTKQGFVPLRRSGRGDGRRRRPQQRIRRNRRRRDSRRQAAAAVRRRQRVSQSGVPAARSPSSRECAP